MIDPFSAIFLIGKASVFVAGIVYLTKITFSLILNWFRRDKIQKLKNEDKDNIAFTLKTALEEGSYTVCQGVFNTRTGDVVDGQKLKAKEIEASVAESHREKPLVIYN